MFGRKDSVRMAALGRLASPERLDEMMRVTSGSGWGMLTFCITVIVAFTIGGDGQVTEASVSRNTTGNETLGRCLAAQVRSWRLPAPGGPVELEIPFSR